MVRTCLFYTFTAVAWILSLVGKLRSRKLRFFTSHHRQNLVRDKVVGKKWIYLERHAFHRQNMVCLKRQE